MLIKDFKYLVSRSRAEVLSYFGDFLLREYPHLDAKIVKKFSFYAKQILQIFENFNGRHLAEKEQQVLVRIVKNEIAAGLSLEQSLALKLILRDRMIFTVGERVLKSRAKEHFGFWEWCNKVSSNILPLVINNYELFARKECSESSELYQEFLDRSFELAFVIKTDGSLGYFNKQMVSLTGYAASKLRKMKFEELLHPGEHKTWQTMLDTGAGNNSPLELRLLSKQNITKKIVLQIHKKMRGNRLIALQCMGRDISVDEVQKGKMDERYQKMQEAYVELGKVNRQMAFLQELCLSLARDKDFSELIRHMLYIFSVLLHADNLILRRLDSKKEQMIFVAAHNFEDEWRKVKFIKNKNNIAWDAVENACKIYIPDISYDNVHKYNQIARKKGFQTALSFPIYCRGEIIGVLTAFSCNKDGFRDYPEDLLDAILAQIALVFLLSKDSLFRD